MLCWDSPSWACVKALERSGNLPELLLLPLQLLLPPMELPNDFSRRVQKVCHASHVSEPPQGCPRAPPEDPGDTGHLRGPWGSDHPRPRQRSAGRWEPPVTGVEPAGRT